MMGAATLQPPKTGRSRFSKALPAPPSLPSFEFESQLDLSLEPLAPLAPPTPLTPAGSDRASPRLQFQPQGPLPPLPPPKAADREPSISMASMARPMDSPLPPVPSKLGGPPASVPRRRPVAAPVTVTPTLAPAPAPAYTTPASTPSFITTPASTTAPVLAIPEPEPSPVGSFSSLFSAYDNRTDDDARTSPTNPARDVVSSGNSYSVVSPTLGAQRSGAQPGAPTYALAQASSDQNASNLGHRDQMLEELPPPPPLKDVRGSRPGTPTGLHIQTAQPAASTLPGPQLTGGSPQQDRLWRRRSRSLKADKGFAVPDLKLVSSHGSTAASVQDSTQSSPSSLFSQSFPLPPPRINPGSSEAALTPRAPPPRSAIGGLPGRNIRPVQDDQATPRDINMGQETSKIKESVQTARRGGSGEVPKIKTEDTQSSQAGATLGAATSSSLSAVSPLSAQRLPTPDYGANDVKNPLPASVVSPLSPAESPNLPEPKSAIQPTTQSTIGIPEAQLRHARSTPSLTLPPTIPGARSPMGLPSSPRPGMKQGPGPEQPLPPIPAPERNQPPNQKQYLPYSPPTAQNQPAARTSASSRGSQDQRPLPGSQPGHHISPSQSSSPWALAGPNPIRDPNPATISETGSIETVRPSQLPQQQQQQPDLPPLREPDPNEPDTTDNPGAARFPRGWYTPQPADTIPDARPLTERQFRCLTQHRYMTANKQRTNPVACRVCGHKDRWAECFICSACHLNVCGGCNAVLRRVKGDLRAVVEERAGKGVTVTGQRPESEERGRERVRAGE